MENDIKYVLTGFLVLVLVVLTWMWGYPKYKVYSRELNGQAQLKEADWNRQIAIREAEAKKKSAKLEAEAEVERAKGVAEANKIIGESLEGNEQYLRYLWVNNLEKSESDVIYVPTEAGLPLLEATRFNKRME